MAPPQHPPQGTVVPPKQPAGLPPPPPNPVVDQQQQQAPPPEQPSTPAHGRPPRARIPTYIGGLDDLMQGGVPEGFVVLLAGKPGSLKSTVAYNILYNLANQRGDRVLYLTLEQDAGDLVDHMSGFGLSDQGLRQVMTMDLSALKANQSDDLPLERMDWFKAVSQAIKVNHAHFGLKAVVVDSLNAMYQFSFESEIRTKLFTFFHELRQQKVTTFMLAEMHGTDEITGAHGMEAFLADGIIHLDLRRDGMKVGRYIAVSKMRATKHSPDYYPLIADEQGFRIVVR